MVSVRAGLTLFGPIDSGRVSGLAIFQARLKSLLDDEGAEVVPITYSADERQGDQGRVIGFPRGKRQFFLEDEGRQLGLRTTSTTRRCTDRLLRLFDRERLESLIMVEWMPLGMAAWEAALRWGGPVVFLPTEHGAICQYGFLLHNCGKPCDLSLIHI